MMHAKALKTLEARSVEDWRAWLAAHHQSESEVWLVFRKRHTGQPSIDYAEALDEAICFGWIDSLVRRLDDARYARKFTPRKPHSKWSSANRQRYAALQASGRLTPAGLGRAPSGRSGDAPRPSILTLPGYIEHALRARPSAWTFFQSLAPSYRRLYIAWIDSGKLAKTKQRRLEEAVSRLITGKKLGLK